jgi:hypothetical protein
VLGLRLFGGMESWRHSLFECNMARSVCALSDASMVQHMNLNLQGHARQWLFDTMRTFPHERSSLEWQLHFRKMEKQYTGIFSKLFGQPMGLSILILQS